MTTQQLSPLRSLLTPAAIRQLVEFAGLTPVAGAVAEVGVYQGGSAIALYTTARKRGQDLYLFDTFTGIPCANSLYDRHKIGEFADTDVEHLKR